MLKTPLGILLTAGIFVLTACSTASDRLNEKLAGQSLDQRFITLRDECAAASATPNKNMVNSDPTKLLQLCDGMEELIKDGGTLHPATNDADNENFDALYGKCVEMSKVKSAGLRRTYNPVRPSIPSSSQYDYRVKALCDAYKNMSNGG